MLDIDSNKLKEVMKIEMNVMKAKQIWTVDSYSIKTIKLL